MQYYCLLKNVGPIRTFTLYILRLHNPPAANMNNQSTIIIYYTDIDILPITNKHAKSYL